MIDGAIYNLIQANTDISESLRENTFVLLVPDEVVFPYCVIGSALTQVEGCKIGAVLDEYTVRISIWDKDYDSLLSNVSKLRKQLERYRGTITVKSDIESSVSFSFDVNIHNSLLKGITPDIDVNSKGYGMNMTFSFKTNKILI